MNLTHNIISLLGDAALSIQGERKDHIDALSDALPQYCKTYDEREMALPVQRDIFISDAKAVFDITGICCNNHWFETQVFPVLKQAYTQKMYENTVKYLVIPDDINFIITQYGEGIDI